MWSIVVVFTLFPWWQLVAWNILVRRDVVGQPFGYLHTNLFSSSHIELVLDFCLLGLCFAIWRELHSSTFSCLVRCCWGVFVSSRRCNAFSTKTSSWEESSILGVHDFLKSLSCIYTPSSRYQLPLTIFIDNIDGSWKEYSEMHV